MPDTDIICKRCGKAARIQAADGKLCIDCWREVRAENREIKTQDNLNKCFGFKSPEKISDKEAKIINEIMEELEDKKGL